MSGFFGVFSPNGGIDRIAFDEMQKAIQYDGCDGLEICVDEHIALGQLILKVKPEPVNDNQPVKSNCGRYLLVGHFRLDYRDELGDKLGLTQRELDSTPDSVLAIKSYQKWSEKCVNHLEGDWAFVIYDKEKNKILFFRDPCGYSILFYSIYNSQVYFTTDPLIYYRLKKFDLKIDFEQLYRLSFARGKIDDGKTLMSNISVVESSSYVEISNLFEIKHWYYIGLNINNINYRSIEDYFFDIKSKLSNAILQRIKYGKIGVFQSAGFDSSTISYFVSKELQYRNSNFKTFTSFPKYLSSYSFDKQCKIREDEKVRQLLSNFNNCTSVYLSFPDEKFAGLIDLKKNTNIINPIISVNSFWIDGIIKVAKEEGVDILLAGKMGNYTYSWNANFIAASYFYKFNWNFFYEHCKAVSSNTSDSIMKVALRELYGPFLIQIQAFIKKADDLLFGKIYETAIFKKKSIIKGWQSFFSKSSRFHPVYTGFKFPENLRRLIFQSNVDQLGQRSYLDFQENSILITDPFTDRRFVEYSFSIPEYLFNYFGEQKFISKSLLSELYPAGSLNISSGVPQAYDISIRLKFDFDLNLFLRHFNENPEFKGLFDEVKIRNLYLSINERDTNGLDMIKSQNFLKALSIIAFYYNWLDKKLNFTCNN